jgi:hypothetical protein
MRKIGWANVKAEIRKQTQVLADQLCQSLDDSKGRLAAKPGEMTADDVFECFRDMACSLNQRTELFRRELLNLFSRDIAGLALDDSPTAIGISGGFPPRVSCSQGTWSIAEVDAAQRTLAAVGKRAGIDDAIDYLAAQTKTTPDA